MSHVRKSMRIISSALEKAEPVMTETTRNQWMKMGAMVAGVLAVSVGANAALIAEYDADTDPDTTNSVTVCGKTPQGRQVACLDRPPPRLTVQARGKAQLPLAPAQFEGKVQPRRIGDSVRIESMVES